MLPKQIKSLQHPFVKKIVKIRKDKGYRAEKNLVLAVGNKIVSDISKMHKPSAFLTTDQNFLESDTPTIQITPAIMNKIAGLHTQEKVAALFAMPDEKAICDEKAILSIDMVSDPGNLGTLFRSALALKFDAIILLANTVDPFNDKAIRASKGACFLLPFCKIEKDEFIKLLQVKKITPYVADMQGEDIKKIKIKKPFTLILSNEARGKDLWPKNFINIAIPMNKNVESLNVATSGSILMYVMQNG